MGINLGDADDTRPTPLKKRRLREPSRLREKSVARARQVPKRQMGTDGRRRKAADADADGVRPPTSAELRCPVSAAVDPVTDFFTGGVITVGADCAGLLSEALALDYLGVEYEHKFAAESNVKVRHLLYSKFGKDSMQFYKKCHIA